MTDTRITDQNKFVSLKYRFKGERKVGKEKEKKWPPRSEIQSLEM
jgi:hypothetical protein